MIREELKAVERALLEHDWVLSSPAKEGEYSGYVKGYDDGKNVIEIQITLDPCSLDVNGHYGIGDVRILRYEYDMPYYIEDLREMERLLYKVEDELVRIGVPFVPYYGFGKSLERNLRKNYELRERYQLSRCESEDNALEERE